MYYIGIDPGKSGAFAIISEKGEIIDLHTFDEELLVSTLKNYNNTNCKCVLEKVNAMPGQGVSSMFSFGMNFGFIQGVLKTNTIPFELVPPQKWKKEFSVTSDKNTSIDVAKRLFPNVNLKATDRCKKDHDGLAEALLMAEYAKRKL